MGGGACVWTEGPHLPAPTSLAWVPAANPHRKMGFSWYMAGSMVEPWPLEAESPLPGPLMGRHRPALRERRAPGCSSSRDFPEQRSLGGPPRALLSSAQQGQELWVEGEKAG